ncbi:MAG TPA: PilT/PilU family type 4a pilus ATPase, partial [Labilithrix sp.]|nr:PilT/PilU family type 4a pilus ATPase [Labilithrix sp.]
MSQLTPFLRKLVESGAERAYFAPNEGGVAIDGEAKRLITGPVRAATIFEAVSELLSQDDLRSLTSRPRVVRHEQDGESFVLEIIRHDAGVALGIRHARPGGRVAPAAAPPVSPAAPDAQWGAGAQGQAAARAQGRQRAMPAPIELDPMVNGPAVEVARQQQAGGRGPIELDLGSRASGQRPSSAGMPAAEPAGPAAVAPSRGGPPRIDAYLREMLQRKASDLHLSAGNFPVLRIDGEIHFGSDKGHVSSADIHDMLQEIMPARAKNDFAELNDADFAYELPGLARFRVNAFVDRNGTGAVIRQIPIEILSAEKLGLPKACIDMCWLSKGLVLVTGPTGSGKSTTLAAMVDFINKNRSDHIITIEDPVEFVHKSQKCLVNQREVGQHTKSFKNALRAALREDPDIVLVGEMRDLETISIAIETAETGHLVFGTLHTTTAISTVDRIIDQFPS